MAVNKVEYYGKVLLDLTEDTVAEDTLHKGVIAHDKSGAKITGTFSIDGEIETQEDLILAIKTALQGKASGGGGTSTPTQEKTIDITENGTYEVTPDSGYALSKVTAKVNVASSGGGGGDPTLPEGYVRCGYIRFVGEQIVDTGIVPTQDTKIRVVFVRNDSASMYMYGVVNSGNTASVTAYLTSSSGTWRFGNKSVSKVIATNTELVQTAIVSKSSIVMANSTSTFSGVNNFTAVGSLLLGATRNANGSVGSAQFVGDILVFEMWQGSEKVLRLTPLMSIDGVYRFYDEVSGTFYDSITDTPLEGGNL